MFLLFFVNTYILTYKNKLKISKKHFELNNEAQKLVGRSQESNPSIWIEAGNRTKVSGLQPGIEPKYLDCKFKIFFFVN